MFTQSVSFPFMHADSSSEWVGMKWKKKAFNVPFTFNFVKNDPSADPNKEHL